MEDPTFDATVMAVNPRARARAEHRPPLRIGHVGPVCRWRVFLGDEAGRVEELPITRQVAASRAARFRFAMPEADPGEGMRDYRGPLRPDFALEDFAQPVLARQCKEFALDVHLLMRGAYASLRARHGAEVARGLAREHWEAVAPVYVPRVREALGIGGDDVASILKTLQVDPGLPFDYVARGCALLPDGRGQFWLEDCEALAEGEPDAWTDLLADAERPGFEAVVAAVNPRALCRRIPSGAPSGARGAVRHAFEIGIDASARPRPESPLAGAVRFSTASSFSFRSGRAR
jgi:hypothetical protein